VEIHITLRRYAMEKSSLAKYFRKGLVDTPTPHPEVSAPRLSLKSDEEYGNRQFSMSWWAISEPFVMVTEHHKHDFDQFLVFVGGDITNMVDLGGEVELTLSEDGVNTETFIITEATTIFVPKGLYHCPLNFKKINDPRKPILFHDLFFSPTYGRA
jgi:mannose-6-phosphate isomerase-like protein (cupin superfamily)